MIFFSWRWVGCEGINTIFLFFFPRLCEVTRSCRLGGGRVGQVGSMHVPRSHSRLRLITTQSGSLFLMNDEEGLHEMQIVILLFTVALPKISWCQCQFH